MVLPQDYVAVQWPVTQFTYDASTFEIGTFCHYAPAWNGLIQGIQGVGIGQRRRRSVTPSPVTLKN